MKITHWILLFAVAFAALAYNGILDIDACSNSKPIVACLIDR